MEISNRLSRPNRHAIFGNDWDDRDDPDDHMETRLKSCIGSEKNSLGRYFNNTKKELLAGAKTFGVTETNQTVRKSEFRNRWTDEGLRKWMDKAIP